MLRLLSSLSFLVFLVSGFAALAEPMTEKQKIDGLLDALDAPGISFIRNGETHDGAWAKQHLADKLKKATPEITTADDFIAKVASTSSKTGKPYFIKAKGKKAVKAATWFRARLAGLDKPAAAAKQ